MNEAAATPPRSRARLFAASLLLAATWQTSACGTATDIVAVEIGAPEPPGSSGRPSAAGTGGRGSEGCQTYPTIALGPSSTAVCTASFARDRMSHALCACRDLNMNGPVYVAGYDSTGGVSTSESGAAVGVNGSATPDAFMSIDGSLTLGGSVPQTFAGLTVSGDLRLAAESSSSGSVRVGRDLWLGGPLSVAELRVTRDLYLAPSATLQATRVEEVGGGRLQNSSPLGPPCRCGSDAAFDLAAVIEQARLQNDNASIGLSPDGLMGGALSTGLTLPCGKFFLNSIESILRIALRITGKTALFVAGDVATPGHLEIVLDPGAELDWFVLGTLNSGVATVGDPERAGALRLYIGGADAIDFSGLEFAGNLYAPNADVTVLGDFAGSIFARDISLPSLLKNEVHYDRAVLAAGDACSAGVVTSCSGCGECGAGLACVKGTCSSCTSDQDCCSPLVCQSGRCQPLHGTVN